MNFFKLSGRLGRIVIATILLYTSAIYVHDSTFDGGMIDIAQKIKGEFSTQFGKIEVELAVNDSTLILKVEA